MLCDLECGGRIKKKKKNPSVIIWKKHKAVCAGMFFSWIPEGHTKQCCLIKTFSCSKIMPGCWDTHTHTYSSLSSQRHQSV